MKELDLKHIAYHVLVGLYFIWLSVFAVLVAFAISSNLYGSNTQLSKISLLWIFLNMIIGTSLFLVLQLFGNRKLLGRLIKFTYIFMAIASVTTTLIAIVK